MEGTQGSHLACDVTEGRAARRRCYPSRLSRWQCLLPVNGLLSLSTSVIGASNTWEK